MTYKHKACGLTLCLPFPCPALPEAREDEATDVTLIEGIVPRTLEGAVAGTTGWEAAPGRFLLRAGRRAGRFLVQDGCRVVFHRSPAAEQTFVARLVADTVLVALLRQRGHLVLHAVAATGFGGAVAVAGESGAGKSTTLRALLDRGFQMLADDVVAIRLSANGRPEVLPGVARLYLTSESARRLGVSLEGLERDPFRRMKAALPTAPSMAPAPAPLNALFCLRPHAGARLTLERARGAAAFELLQSSVYGPMLASEHPALFPLAATIGGQTAIFRVKRPLKRWTAPELADAILAEQQELRA
ncbi:MAG: hypothetical protein HY303_09910 [Candidatus Wallbacteria bacterium]|nr:hypothetical protein [Candidatus Wallbacteria bacterium]